MRTYLTWCELVVIAAVLVPCATVNAAMHHVRSTGADSVTCGALASPCRSITQAIANASDGDSIIVGPGLYGDLNDDGMLSGTGGEEPNIGACTPGLCMIRVNKSVKIASTDGAGATVIRAPAGLNLDAVVSLESADAALGRPNKGFSVAGGLTCQVNGSQVSGLSVIGNRILPGADCGISVGGDDAVVSDNIAIGDRSPSTGIGWVATVSAFSATS